MKLKPVVRFATSSINIYLVKSFDYLLCVCAVLQEEMYLTGFWTKETIQREMLPMLSDKSWRLWLIYTPLT